MVSGDHKTRRPPYLFNMSGTCVSAFFFCPLETWHFFMAFSMFSSSFVVTEKGEEKSEGKQNKRHVSKTLILQPVTVANYNL
jgi:CRISPR/Cas system-associated exonuclease Cas4 (RecB family)